MTIRGWSCYGEKAAEYLLGTKAVPIVWSFADVANALMAIPNLISLAALNRILVAETRGYLWTGNLDKAVQE